MSACQDGLGSNSEQPDPESGQAASLTQINPCGDQTQATYDYFGEQATTTDPIGTATGTSGHTTDYAYDYLGDLTKVTTPDGDVSTST